MGESGIVFSEQEENSLKDPRLLNMLNDSENYMVVISYQQACTLGAISGSGGYFDYFMTEF